MGGLCQDMYSTSLTDALNVFKSSCLFSPQAVHLMHPDIAAVDTLSVIRTFPKFRRGATCPEKELPTYLTLVADTSAETDQDYCY